jgi:3'(2'), 5'-bisphosphate nucleotidase
VAAGSVVVAPRRKACSAWPAVEPAHFGRQGTNMLSDHRDAAELAEAAGRILLRIRAAASNPNGLGPRGDRISNEFLVSELRRRHPDDAILSEETADNPRRLRARRVWILDPLDGTREFAEPPRDDWAVHVALWEEGRLFGGAIALPARGELMSTANPPCRPESQAGPLRIVVSRTRAPAFSRQLASFLGAELVEMGSAGAKTAAVIRGEADAYVHSGGQYEWDSAAPAAVATATGFHVSRLNGEALVFNQPDPFIPDILVCKQGLVPRMLTAIASATGGSE